MAASHSSQTTVRDHEGRQLGLCVCVMLLSKFGRLGVMNAFLAYYFQLTMCLLDVASLEVRQHLCV